MTKLKVGGQAVIEGVMMRSPSYIATSVKKGKKIICKKEKIKPSPKIFQLPFIRGIYNLFDMLVLGLKSLIWSANISEDKEDEKLNNKEVAWIIFTSFVLALLFFVALPFYLTRFIVSNDGFWFNLIDGIIRIALFLIYILLISRMQDVKRLFEYHGAEHKAVHCYEHGLELNVKNVKKFSTLHPRCGSAFVAIVLIVSIIVFSLTKNPAWYIKLLSRFILIPIIAGISYEILKLSDKFRDNFFVGIMILPGMWIQKITTKEPNDDQIKVAIHALKTVINEEKK